MVWYEQSLKKVLKLIIYMFCNPHAYDNINTFISHGNRRPLIFQRLRAKINGQGALIIKM